MNQKQKAVLIIGSLLVVLLVIIAFAAVPFRGWHRNDFGMMEHRMMEGFGPMIMVFILLCIVVFGLIIWAVMGAFNQPGPSDRIDSKENSSLEILKERYARGEIDQEEFEAKKKDLSE